MSDSVVRFDPDVTVIHEDDLLDQLDKETVEIPAWIEEIEEGSFAHGRRKKKIVVQDNPFFKYENGFLYDSRNKKLIHYNGSDKTVNIPAEMDVIGRWAFYECQPERIVFEREIREIHEDAFTTCLMKEAVFSFWNCRIFFPERDIRMRQHMLEGFGRNGEMFDFDRYDEDLVTGYIEPERMREIIARLKWPHALSAEKKDRFEQILLVNYAAVIEELGRAEDTETITWLCGLQYINEENIDMTLEVLHGLKNLEPYVFLSRYKNEHWGRNNFDFSL